MRVISFNGFNVCLIDDEWFIIEDGKDERTKIADSTAGYLIRCYHKEIGRLQRESAFWDDIARQHDALVHPDGSECPDGCGGW